MQDSHQTELVPLPAATRCDIALQKYFGLRYSRSQLQAWIKNKRVFLQDSIVEKPSYKSKFDTELRIHVPAEPKYALAAMELPLKIVFENSDFAVIDKPAGLTVHPGAGTKSSTLAHALLHEFSSLSDVNGDLRPGIVHRLDKETSGLLLIAKNNLTHRKLAKLFHDRHIIKRYRSWVKGKFPQRRKQIDGYIARDTKNRVKMRFDYLAGNLSKKASLIVSLVKEITAKDASTFSLLDIQLLTGRTHQIRATLNFLKLPIVNDSLYGIVIRDKDLPSNNMLLQAYHLQFHLDQDYQFVLEEPKSFADFEKLISVP